MESYFINIFGFLIGTSFGSFLNVLIRRLPAKEDIVFERSHCPNCRRQIPWYLNIPIVSYLALKGRCAWCNVKIPISYLTIEVLAGLLGIWLIPNPFTPMGLGFYFLNLSILLVFIAIIVIDLKYHLIPDLLNIYLAVVFLFTSIFQYNWTHWLFGGVVGFGVPFLVTILFYKIKGQIGLGGGDIKLFGALGLTLGPIGVLENIFFSCFLGSLIGALLLLTKRIDRKTPMPFGPFIVLVAIVQLYFPHYFIIIKRWLIPYA